MKAGQKLLTGAGAEVALFPDTVLCVTQAPNGAYSHLGTNRMDTGGPGVNKYYAPCTLKVVKNNDPNYHEVLLWTVNPVQTRDYGLRHLTFMLSHDSDVSDLTVGKIIPQGAHLYDEGGQGPNGPRQYPSHIDMIVALDHTTWKIKKESGKYDLRNSVSPETVLFINDTTVIQDGGLKWSVYKEPVGAKVGDKVRIKKTATVYSTGEPIKDQYKVGGTYANVPYVILKDGDTSSMTRNRGHWLLSRIYSWVKKSEVEKL